MNNDITYTWQINQVRVTTIDSMENVVSNVDYTIMASDGVNKVYYPGRLDLDLSEVDANTLISFGDLTSNVVEGWITTALNNRSPNTISEIENSLALNLQALAYKPMQLPWIPGVDPANIPAANTSNVSSDSI